MFSRAEASMESACSFISLLYALISEVRSAIWSTSSLTDSVLALITEAFAEISCIVAESSSVSAERSDTLPFDVTMLSRTSPTTSSILLELLTIILKISCSLSMKTLMPFPTAATSWFADTLTRLVRSPSRLSISCMIFVISFCVLTSGRMTNLNTHKSVARRDAILMMIATMPVTSEVWYTVCSCCFATSAFSFTFSRIAAMLSCMAEEYSAIVPFASAYAASLSLFALYAIRFASSYFMPS